MTHTETGDWPTGPMISRHTVCTLGSSCTSSGFQAFLPRQVLGNACDRLYHTTHTLIGHFHLLATCRSGRIYREDTAIQPYTEGSALQGGPGSYHGNGYHNNNTSAGCRRHPHRNTTHTETKLQVHVGYKTCVCAPSLGVPPLLQHMGSGSSAHSPSPGNVTMPPGEDRTHTPACFLSQWLCRRRAMIGPLLDTPLLTRTHSAGEHSTGLWNQTVIGR